MANLPVSESSTDKYPDTARLQAELLSARRTIATLMDRLEATLSTTEGSKNLSQANLALQGIVKRRTHELNRLNAGLMSAAMQRRHLDRILREMQRLALIGGWELDPATGQVDLTEQTYTLLGLPPGIPATIESILNIFPPATRTQLFDAIHEVCDRQAPFDIEMELPAPACQPRIFRVVGHPVIEDGRVVRVYGVFKDRTAERAAEIHLAQSGRLESIGQLAAGVAHEINTPTQYVGDNVRFLQSNFDSLLRLVEMCVDIVRSGDTSDFPDGRSAELAEAVTAADFDFLRTEIPAAITQALEGLDRVAQIVGALKEFSHPGSTHKDPADLHKAIGSTIEVARNRWKFAARMQTDFDPLLPLVPCRMAEFNQVILNLIVNAADAIAARTGGNNPELGSIVVSTRLLGKSGSRVAEIRVRDNGGGIPPAVRDRIFEPFFTTKEVGKGTGQGLAISRNVIVAKHGGELLYEVEDGVGTTFIIRLPVDLPETAAAPGGQQGSAAATPDHSQSPRTEAA